MNDASVESVSFGPFDLFPRARLLYKAGKPVVLGSRALDILIALVEQAGEVVNQRELIARAWRGLVVESGNLRVQVTHLRQRLGDGEQGARYIANVPAQGYCFVAAVRRADSGDALLGSTHAHSNNRSIVREPRQRDSHAVSG
jgi:DNA-binding winged helix-turn-helix (wHTH) protein